MIQVLDQARRAWQGQFDIKATVRIGSGTAPERDQRLEKKLEELRAQRDWIASADVCDPVDIAMGRARR